MGREEPCVRSHRQQLLQVTLGKDSGENYENVLQSCSTDGGEGGHVLWESDPLM